MKTYTLIYEGSNESQLLNIDYPYKNLFMTQDNVNDSFNKIKDYRLKLVNTNYKIINMPELNDKQLTFQGKKTICELSESDYWNMNWLSDWFNEKCRIKAKRYDEEFSPYEYWTNNKDKIINDIGGKTDDYKKLNDQIYKYVIGCNNFRPGLLVGMIHKFNSKSVLDFSSGWGDRLIGAIAANVRYVGVDPNDCVHDGYLQIIDRFAEDKQKYTMIKSPFQTANLPMCGELLETYDLIFTSPPYFNLEIYSNDKTQSISEFPDINDWFEEFLMTSIKKAWNVLNIEGYMVIIINNIRGKIDFTQKMINRINEYHDAHYMGVISYAEKRKFYKSPQPMWIWKKIKYL